MFLKSFTFFLFLGLFSPAIAQLKVHEIFSDNMVLQRDQQITVWGTARPKEEIYVHLHITTADGSREEGSSTIADESGNWSVKLAEFPVGTNGKLTVTGSPERKPGIGKQKGPESRTFSNIAVGEVWLCSGQSNMEWPLSKTVQAQQVIANSSNPNIRLFTVPKFAIDTPQTQLNPKVEPASKKWFVCNPQTVANFSAVGYHFGKKLQAELNVPIGLIHTSWGGTPAEAWTSRPGLQNEETLKYYTTNLDQASSKYDPEKSKSNYEEQMKKWRLAADAAKKNGKQIPRQPRLAGKPGTNSNDPSSLYNGMIHPLLGLRFRGAIWYQGESNAGTIARATEYQLLFSKMIADWRTQFKQGDFSFYFVQLAPFNAGNPMGENWPILRESQLKTAQTVKNTGMAVITDVGNPTDIHPQDKAPVGTRLALLALAKDYQKKIVPMGPVFSSMTTVDSSCLITFQHAENGLISSDGKELTGFTICGEDQVFHPATATIKGNEVIVVSDKVKKPVAVRYGWANYPIVNLANKEGIPATPFRTDNFEVK
ncbi:MAG: sialate O-acetylesterase [Zavarzinella sp.]